MYVAEYGTDINPYLKNKEALTLDCLQGVKSKEYYLVVARLEPENNIKMIIEGFKLSRSSKTHYNCNLNTKHSNELSIILIMTFYLLGVYDKKKLQIIRANCYGYIHGHSVGGTNPSLLEALGSNNICICHSNIFNKTICEDLGFYLILLMNLSLKFAY